MLINEGKIERLVVALSVKSNYSVGRSVEILRAGMLSTNRAEISSRALSREVERRRNMNSRGLAQIRSRSLRLASGDPGQQGDLTTNTTVIFVFFQVRPGRPLSRDRPESRDTRII